MSPQPAPPIQLLVDSDGGVDDIAALWYLLTSELAEVVAVTTTGGNVDVDVAAANLRRVAVLAGAADLPIAVGSDADYGAHPSLRRADFVHGADGVGNTGRRPDPWTPDQRDVVDVMADAVAARPGQLCILTLGPLRNLARFVDAHPTLVPAVGQVVVMGGTVERQGNAFPIAEANVVHDPAAAARVATAPWACPPVLVPLDVTLAATLTPDEFALLAEERTPAAADLRAPLEFYRQHGGTFSEPGESPCHDLTAAIVALEPDLMTAPLLALGVDTAGGLAWGTTVVDRRRPYFERSGPGSTQAAPAGMAEWRVGLDIDTDAVRHRYRRMFGATA